MVQWTVGIFVFILAIISNARGRDLYFWNSPGDGGVEGNVYLWTFPSGGVAAGNTRLWTSPSS